MTECTIDVRAVQKSPVLGDVEHNARLAETAIENATDDGIDLLVFPELFLTGYHVGELDSSELIADVEAAIERLTNTASELVVILGTALEEEGTLYNSAIIIDEGNYGGAYHKTHLYGEEGTVFDAGESFPIFETSVGAIGMQICYDVEFPEVSRQLTLAGAEILVTPLANMRPFQSDQQIFTSARALENIRPHVVCNRIGEEHDLEFFGASAIIDERGRPIISAGEDTAIELTATVELQNQGAETLQYLDDRRPNLYEDN